MKLKDAMNKMKNKANKPLKFFYCEKGEDGNPVVLMGTKIPSKEEQAEILKTAQSKKVSRGSMSIDETGTLCIEPKGSAPSSLERGIVIACYVRTAPAARKTRHFSGNFGPTKFSEAARFSAGLLYLGLR